MSNICPHCRFEIEDTNKKICPRCNKLLNVEKNILREIEQIKEENKQKQQYQKEQKRRQFAEERKKLYLYDDYSMDLPKIAENTNKNMNKWVIIFCIIIIILLISYFTFIN